MKQYDLEEAIMKAWQTSDDLEMFFRHHCDNPKPMTEDEVSNMIYGVKQIHDMRMECLWDVFKQTLQLDEYCTDPSKLQYRTKLYKALDEVANDTPEPAKKGKKNVQKA